MDKISEILDFWFEDLSDDKKLDSKDMSVKKWFIKDEDFDQKIKDKFEDDFKKAVGGEYKDWEENVKGRLALILLFDQFTRNMFRESGDMFSADSKALELSKRSIEDGKDKELQSVERVFIYMPLMHAEDEETQLQCIESFEGLIEDSKETSPQNIPYFESNLNYAKKHYEIIKRFGRFPHRNSLLKRDSTEEEAEFLKTPGSSF